MLGRSMATLACLLLPAVASAAKVSTKTPARASGRHATGHARTGHAEAEPPGPKAVPFDARWLTPFFTTGPAAAAAERFRLEDWKAAAAGFEKASHKLPASSPERLPALTLLAHARMNLGLWTDAGALFEDLYDKD